MKAAKKHISVFEHQPLRKGDGDFGEHQLEALQKYHGEKGTPFFTLIHNGVKFCEYVGVLQVGNVTIEVLPKIDRNDTDTDKWHGILIDMLRQSGILKVSAPSSASLRLKSNSILDLYIELFLNECERFFHKGLVKKYRKTEGNLFALKGALQFGKHIQQNLIHQERFYTRYTTYDKEHPLNKVLYKTIHLLSKINTSSLLTGRINRLLIDFPELKDIAVSDAFFNRLVFDRKTEDYRQAIEIAKLLLLNYHPDIMRGQNHVLALLFDMNLLWESYVYKKLKKLEDTNFKVKAQQKQVFWKPENGYSKNIKPDIVISIKDVVKAIIDTKWKLPNDMLPSDDDLKQMFAYNKRFLSIESVLLYPGNNEIRKGAFFDDGFCSVQCVSILKEKKLDAEVFKEIKQQFCY